MLRVFSLDLLCDVFTLIYAYSAYETNNMKQFLEIEFYETYNI